MILIQASRNAMVNDLAVRNVADLAAAPPGKPGRPSRSLNLEQALAVLDGARRERPWPYVAVIIPGGIRAEEARALRWPEVDLEAGPAAVRLRSDSGGPIERIADAVGHSSTWTTEVVYRHQLRPVTRTAAIALGPLSESRGETTGGRS